MSGEAVTAGRYVANTFGSFKKDVYDRTCRSSWLADSASMSPKLDSVEGAGSISSSDSIS